MDLPLFAVKSIEVPNFVLLKIGFPGSEYRSSKERSKRSTGFAFGMPG